MYANTTRGLNAPGTTAGGLILSDSDECPNCGRALADHGFAHDGPGGQTTLTPCGLDVSRVPLETVLDAVRGDA